MPPPVSTSLPGPSVGHKSSSKVAPDTDFGGGAPETPMASPTLSSRSTLHANFQVRPEGGGAARELKGEDKWTLKEAVVGGETLVFAVVADGHGGAKAAEYCKEHASQYMIEEASGDASAESLRGAGRRAFARLHKEVRSTGSDHGSTLTVTIVNVSRGEITTVHVGDSAAILVPHTSASVERLKPRRLTAEHRLQDSPEEQKRVVAMGGQLGRLQHPVTKQPGGPLRVFPGGLAIARGIGDADAGKVISPVPATSTVPLTRAMGVAGWDVCVASDGVWDALSHADVVRMCRGSQTIPPSKLAEMVVEQSVNKRHAFNNSGFAVPRDDTTCIILRCADAADAAGLGTASEGGCRMGKCDVAALLVADPIEIDASYVHDEAFMPEDGGGEPTFDAVEDIPGPVQVT